MSKITTGANNSLQVVFWVDWKGHQVAMTWEDSTGVPICSKDTHQIEVMHHNEPLSKYMYGKWVHYCPTMFLYCLRCMALGDEPEPYECNRWGE